MIGAALAGHVYAAVSARPRIARATIAWPLLAIVLTFVLSGGSASRLIAAALDHEQASRACSAQVQLERADQPGPNRSVQAVLDLVSRDLDPLLAYSDDQYLYPSYRRIPATRFQQRYFLIGSIYMGQTGPQYILHDTWRWFRDDLRQANPAAFLEDAAHRLEAVCPVRLGAFPYRIRRRGGHGEAAQRHRRFRDPRRGTRCVDTAEASRTRVGLDRRRGLGNVRGWARYPCRRIASPSRRARASVSRASWVARPLPHRASCSTSRIQPGDDPR